MRTIPLSLFNRITKSSGLELFGVVSAARLAESLRAHCEHLRSWQADGLAGEMQYMNRPADLFGSLDAFLPETRTVAAFAISYAPPGIPQKHINLPPGFGRVARYAWGKDYHRVIRDRLARLRAALEAEAGGELPWRSFSDAVPLLERAIALDAGMGFIGKNCMLIRPGVGSYTFLAEVLIGAEIEFDMPFDSSARATDCGSCSRCLSSCPTEAFRAPHSLDARRCISYLTIEKRTAFSDWEQRAIGDWVFGCDRCQEVCPFNHAEPELVQLPEFSVAEGAGQALALDEVLRIRTGKAFERAFAATPLLRTRREGLLRNACAVAANTGAFQLIDALGFAASDPSELISSSARTALGRLLVDAGSSDRLRIEEALVGAPQ